MLYPNRRPLLISAILVALTSIPTIIVVAAGTVTLQDREPSRPPAIAAPSGPVVVQPHSTTGLREQPSLASESGHGRAVEHSPAEAAGSGGGGAFSLGTGSSLSTATPPATGAGSPGGKTPAGTGTGQSGSGGSTSGVSSGPGDSSGPEDCPTPTPAPS